MMRKPTSARRWVGVCCVISTQIGCGGSDLECGASTVEKDGKCVPAIEACSVGTVLEKGKCVPACAATERWDGTACVALTTCASGTEAMDGGCVPHCGASSYWDGKTCLPIPVCADGTSFNEQSGSCEPNEQVCAAGSTWVNGECVPDLDCGPGTHAEGGACVPDGLPDPDVPESADPNGVANFTLPGEGATIILGGVVDEPEGFASPDWDTFTFTASAGTYLQVEAVSAGALRPGFVVATSELGKDGNPKYVRYGIDRDGLQASREVYLPYTGEYELRVTDSSHVLSSIFSGVQSIPVGGSEFGYAVEVKNLGAPTPEAVSALPSTKTGDFADGTLHFYTVSGLQSGDVVGVSSLGLVPPDTESDAFPAVMVFDPAGGFMHEKVAYQTYADAELPFLATAAGDHLVVQDYLLTIGERDEFSVGMFALTPKDCTAGACASGSIPAKGNALLRWELAEGDFLTAGVYLPGSANEYVKVSFYDGAMAPAVDDSAASPFDVGVGYLYASEDTTAYLWLREWDGVAVPAYTVDARVIATPALTSGGTYNGLETHEMPPYTLRDAGISHFVGKAGQMVFFTSFATHPDGVWLAPQELMMTPQLEPMGPIIDTDAWNFPDGFVTPLFSYIKEDGHYLHYVFDGSTSFPGGTYDVRMTVRDTFPLGAPVIGTAVQVSGHTLGQGMALYTFEGEAKQYYDIKLAPTAVSNMVPDLWVFNFGRAEFQYVSYAWIGDIQSPQLGLIERNTAAANDPVTVGYQSPYDGTTVLLVQTATGSGTALDAFNLTVEAPPPPGNDTCATAGPLALDSNGEASFTWNSSAATNSVNRSGCTDYASDGPDVFFKVDLQEGDTIDVTMHSDEFSGSLYLFTDCQQIHATCRAGSEYGDPRQVTYTVPAGQAGTYVIGADSHVHAGWFDMAVKVTH